MPSALRAWRRVVFEAAHPLATRKGLLERSMKIIVAVPEPGERSRKHPDEEILRRFDEVRARIGERTAGFSEEEVAADVAAALAELPDCS